MRTVWKYPLAAAMDAGGFHAPAPARLLHVGLDPTGAACVWVEVNDDNPVTEKRVLCVTGTGTRIPNETLYVGSFNDGGAVWHVWDVTEYPF